MVERPNRPSALTPGAAAPEAQVNIEGSGYSSKVVATLPSGESVEVMLFGATVTSWKSHGGKTENLWVSENAIYDGSKPIRGGVPIVFPDFGPPPKSGHPTSSLPQHGFARISRWEFLGKSTSEDTLDNNSVKLDFGLYSKGLDEKFRKAWPVDFGLVYSVTLSKDSLQTMINVRNEGETSFEFQFLYHTYLKVNDVSKVAVNGLMGVSYIDKVLDATTHTQSGSVTVTGEVDRVYLSVPQDTTTVVEDGKPRFDIIRDNLQDMVVWNPWVERAKGIPDFSPDSDYMRMICVETGAVNGWQKLEKGEVFEAGQTMKSLL